MRAGESLTRIPEKEGEEERIEGGRESRGGGAFGGYGSEYGNTAI